MTTIPRLSARDSSAIRVVCATALFTIALTSPSVAAEVDILLATNPPPMTEELLDYLSTVQPPSHPLVGFNGANIGQGSGNGVDEFVAFSFVFEPVSQIRSATLTVDLTPRHRAIRSDNFHFADNSSPWGGDGGLGYGNELIYPLPVGVRTVIDFDLRHLSGHYGSGLTYDVTDLLLDGDFNVVYADDAIIHSARLRVISTPTVTELAALVTSLGLPAGIEQSLLAKLDAAGRALARGNNRAASRLLHAFVNQVEAQRGRHITDPDAATLIQAAEAIIATLDADGARPAVVGKQVRVPVTHRGLANMFRLSAISPNPFHHSTTIQYELAQPSGVDLSIYDVRGRLIRTIENVVRPAGHYTVAWDGRDHDRLAVTAGTYFVKLTAGDITRTTKVVFLGDR